MRESKIQADIRKALNLDGRVRLLRNSVGFHDGKCQACGHDTGHRVRYGLGIGSPDLIGVLRDGRVFAIEVKAARGRESPEQVAWWVAARKWGVTGGTARSVAEAMALLNAACCATP